MPDTKNTSSQNDEELNSFWLLFPGPNMLNWRKVIPNFLTIMATVVGLSSVRFAIIGQYELAVLSILAAGVLDGLDGPVARALKGTSNFGAELDSLSDYVNFGVAPALVLYFWSLESLGWIGWSASLFFVICMACRLARFNAGVDFNASATTRNFFMGVPAPAGAMLVVMPLVCSFHFKDKAYFANPTIVIPYTIFCAFLLVSRMPTFSSKLVNRQLVGDIGILKVLLALAVAGGGVFLVTFHTWFFFMGVTGGYIISFPLSFIYFLYLNRKAKVK